MIVLIDTRQAPASVTLQRPTEFDAFHVSVLGTDDDAYQAAVSRIGTPAGAEHVFVDRAALEGLAGEIARDPEWRRSLDSMVRYAESKGWTDDGGAIRAHVEHASGGPDA
jgi:hypothetical protein